MFFGAGGRLSLTCLGRHSLTIPWGNQVRTFYLLRVLGIIVAGFLLRQESATAQIPKDKTGEEISQTDAAERQPSSGETKVQPEVQALIDMAGAVPPEFAANALLRLAESERVTQPSKKVQLISDAFYLAESAQQPLKRRPGTPMAADSRSGFLDDAFRLNLDRLSLQSRAVEDALTLSQTKARTLFEQTELSLEPLGCGEPLAYDLKAFYQTLGKLISNGFTQKEKLQGRRLELLERYITGLRSHSQVGPIAQLLRTVDLSSGDLRIAVNSFATSLATLHGDKRSFTAAARYGDFDSLAGLVTELDAKGVSVVGILQILREYLLSNLRDSPCAELLTEPAEANSLSGAARYFVNRFNEHLGLNVKKYALAPVGRDEIQETLDSSQPSKHDYFSSPKSKELLEGIRELKFGTKQEKLLSAEDRNTGSWNEELSGFLEEFESWEADDEPADDFFYEKAVIYAGLIELTPSGPEQSRIIQSYVNFLGVNAFQVQNRIEWFWQFYLLLGEIRISGLDSRAEIIQMFEKSRDPILGLYARLEQLVPGPTDRLY
jgi:hypothetical protein